jgi:hypothetical protein
MPDPESGPSVVVTGDAQSTNNTNTTENENTVDTGDGSSIMDTTVNASSTGVANTDSTTTAATGDNTDIAGAGVAAVATGDAYAGANVINVVNANIVDSDGFILLLNRLFGGTIDLSGAFTSAFSGGDYTSGCTLYSCLDRGVDFNVNATSTANIDNDIHVQASTGGNTAVAEDGSAFIFSGDAYAGANVVNIANTNIIDSNYVLVSINNLGDLLGDVVLPGADFFNALFGSGTTVGGNTSISTNNTANITNNVSVAADTGNNTANTSGNSLIATGNAQTSSGITNQINSNGIGGTPIRILFRVYGEWDGEIFGLPAGLTWAKTDQGIEIFSSGGDGGAQAIAGNTSVNIQNNATINNNISVVALTGDNEIKGGDGVIQTGNAVAAANLINVANTNVIGQNWIYAIFNIMGNWNGNLAFGRPNLWIGGAANAKGSSVQPGSEVTYTFTVANRGNADSTRTRLKLEYDKTLLRFEETAGLGTSWDIGTIRAGQAIEIVKKAKVVANVGYGDFPMPLLATVSPHEMDPDLSDNTEKLPLVLSNPQPTVGTGVQLTPESDLQVTKTASATHLTAPGSIDYTIKVVNKGGPAFHAELFDNIRNPSGSIINQERWKLGTIEPDEEIVITYTAEFGALSAAGTYSNSAQVKAITRHPSLNPFYGWYGHSNVATTTLVITAAEPTEKKADYLRCNRFIDSFMAIDSENDPEQVKRLQTFLRDVEGHSLEVTGVFDTATEAAVGAYQSKYASEILKPWGMDDATGVVYYTTRKHINDMRCKSMHADAFPLSSQQLKEIETFKRSLERSRIPAAKPAVNPPEASASVDTAEATHGESHEETVPEKSTSAISGPDENPLVAGVANATSSFLSRLPSNLFANIIRQLAQPLLSFRL